MFSSLGVNFSFNKEILEERYVVRRLMSYGVPSSGDLSRDKTLLKKIESGQLEVVNSVNEAKTELYAESTDYEQTNQSNVLEESKIGAEQLGILNKLRLGLV